MITYTTLNVLTWTVKIASSGRIVPDDEDSKEYWSCKSPWPSPYYPPAFPFPAANARAVKTDMNQQPPWFVRAIRGEKQFWRSTDDPGLELQSNADEVPKANLQ